MHVREIEMVLFAGAYSKIEKCKEPRHICQSGFSSIKISSVQSIEMLIYGEMNNSEVES
jgi:hypothetical protein